MQIEFENGGILFRADRLDAFKQLHVSRKIAPVLPKLIPVFLKLAKASESEAGTEALLSGDMAGFVEAAGPFADAFAAMPEADVDYVVRTCLSAVRRNHAGAWAPVMREGAMMFDDLGLEHLLPVVVRVLRENLGNFIQGLLEKDPAANSSAALVQAG
jgi:hypothetical protein